MFQGMAFIHDSVIETHGKLRSSNVYVDSRWMCKVGDFPMPNFCDGEKTRDDEKNSESFSKSFSISRLHLEKNVLFGINDMFIYIQEKNIKIFTLNISISNVLLIKYTEGTQIY